MPQFEFEEIPIPEGMIQCADSMAQLAVHYLQIANGVTDYENFYIPPEDTVDDSWYRVTKPWTWIIQWGVGQIEWFTGKVGVRMKIEDEGDGYYWLTYVGFSKGWFQWQDFRYIEGKLIQNGLGGFFRSYELWSGAWKRHWEWNFNEELQQYNMIVLISEKDEDPELQVSKLELTMQPDARGGLYFYKVINYEYEFVIRMDWQPDGSGSWHKYDENNHMIRGTWSCG